MSATVCTCIRAANIRDVAVPDPTCPACTRRAQQQGNEPTFVIYDETAQADHDAIRASRALGRLLLWALVLIVCVVLFLTPDHHWTGWHWTIAAANTVLALRLTWTGDTP